VSASHLTSLDAFRIDSTDVLNMSTSLESLFIRAFHGIWPSTPSKSIPLIFSRLTALQELCITECVCPKTFVLDLSLLPHTLTTLVVNSTWDQAYGTHHYRILNPEDFIRLRSLKVLRLSQPGRVASDLTDLHHLCLDNIEILDLTGCPLVKDFSPLVNAPKLRKLIVWNSTAIPDLNNVKIVRKNNPVYR
jgi:hypothetical protein